MNVAIQRHPPTLLAAGEKAVRRFVEFFTAEIRNPHTRQRWVTCHSFRASGITAYLSNGGSLETAAGIAGHTSTRTTQLYDRRQEDISLDEIERIVI